MPGKNAGFLGVSTDLWVSLSLVLFFFFPVSSHFLGKVEGAVFTLCLVPLLYFFAKEKEKEKGD